MSRKPTIYIYDPEGKEAACEMAPDEVHIPREGELVNVSDHTDGKTDAYGYEEMWVVDEVQTEMRLVDNMQGGQSWQQLVYVRTKENGC